MSADQRRWYQVGNGKLRLKHGDGWTDPYQRIDNPEAPNPTPTQRLRSIANRDGAMVARSQILVSGSTATLLGVMTNETSYDVFFSGMPPYAITLDADGSRPILLGDFNSPPRERPFSADWVIHPGASIPYRSLPITVQTPDPRWDGTDWSTTSQSWTLDIMTFSNQRELRTIQLFT